MDANELRQQVLAQMINQSLILQAGKRRNIQATDSEIEAVIAHNPNIKNPICRRPSRHRRQHYC